MAETWHVARLKVDVRHEGDIAVIEASGECDLITSRKLKEAADALFKTGCCKIIFDLREMNYIDSSGFRVLLEAKNKATSVTFNVPSNSGRILYFGTSETGCQE